MKTSILKLFGLKDAYRITIKVTKFGVDWSKGFGAMEEKPGDGPFCPPPSLNRVKKENNINFYCK